MVLLVVGPKKTIRGDSMRIVAFNCVVERRVNLFVMSVYVKNKDHQYISFVLSIVQKAWLKAWFGQRSPGVSTHDLDHGYRTLQFGRICFFFSFDFLIRHAIYNYGMRPHEGGHIPNHNDRVAHQWVDDDQIWKAHTHESTGNVAAELQVRRRKRGGRFDTLKKRVWWGCSSH